MENQKMTKKEIAREIGRDIGRSAKGGLKGLGKIAVKAGYPVLGSLSYNIQTKLQDKLGQDVYDAKDAYGVSLNAGIIETSIGSGVGLAYLGTGAGERTAGFAIGVLGGLGVGALYQGIRKAIITKDYGKEYGASFGGKLISLPIDAGFYLVGKTKDYLDNVKRKIASEKSLENKIDGGDE